MVVLRHRGPGWGRRLGQLGQDAAPTELAAMRQPTTQIYPQRETEPVSLGRKKGQKAREGTEAANCLVRPGRPTTRQDQSGGCTCNVPYTALCKRARNRLISENELQHPSGKLKTAQQAFIIRHDLLSNHLISRRAGPHLQITRFKGLVPGRLDGPPSILF
jgi:hypothetical protein